MNPRNLVWLYVATSVINVFSQILPLEELNRYTKPLLMPLLLLYVYRSSLGKTTGKVLLLSFAIIFSWGGDVVLMYQADDIYFMSGIGLFLIAHIFYIITLRKATYKRAKVSPVSILPFLLYGGILFYILLPAGDFTIPIVVYGFVILIMMITAYARRSVAAEKSFKLAFAGSLLFVLSDSVLAINAFKFEVPFAGVVIMSTYCAAQYLLAEGLLSHQE